MAEEDIAEVYWARNPQDAHLVTTLLADAGIEARVVGEMLQAGAGELPMGPSTSPRVWVSRKDEPRARSVIAAWEKERQSEQDGKGAGWECPQCGADVDGAFDICWNCQSPRG